MKRILTHLIIIAIKTFVQFWIALITIIVVNKNDKTQETKNKDISADKKSDSREKTFN